MQTSELKKLYKAREFHGDDGGKWYVLPGEMTAIDAIKLIADKLHISKDKVQETRGYVKDGIFFTCGSLGRRFRQARLMSGQ